MMALDCSPGKQFFFNLAEGYFQSFLHIYIYIYQTLPFDGYLFISFILFYFIYFLFLFIYFFLVIQINLKIFYGRSIQ